MDIKTSSKGKMPSKRGVDACMTWICDERDLLCNSEYGTNIVGVQEALQEQAKRSNTIKHYKGQVTKALSEKDASNHEKKSLKSAYSSLKTLSDKRSHCLDTVSKVASLEEFCSNLGAEFDTTAANLVKAGKTPIGDPNGLDSLSVTRSSQDCIFAVRNNWSWVKQLSQCLQTHLENAAEYHEFFHEVEECDYWMNMSLASLYKKFADKNMDGDRESAMRLMKELKETLTNYLQWQGRVDSLFEKSKELIPVKQRTDPLKQSRPVKALCDYKTKDFSITKDEDLVLLDNSNTTRWKVRTSKGQEAHVPALVVLIPPCDPEAVDAATRLRLQLLAIWTASVKRLGKQIIELMLMIFRDWSEEEMSSLRNLSPERKQALLGVLNFIQSTLDPQWHDYPPYMELLERFARLKMILEQEPDGRVTDESAYTTLVIQMKTLEDLMKRYKDFWTYWETFKVVMETLRQPRHILICDKWEQLRYVTTAYFVKFWQTELTVDDIAKTEEIAWIHETPKKALKLNKATVDELDANMDMTTELRTAETEQITQSEQEEKKTFVIKAVINPQDGEPISMQQAVMLGIIDQNNGTYVNATTGKAIPIPQAMSEGLIQVGYTTTKRSREERKSIGLITIKTSRQSRPYTVTSALDSSGKELSVAEAIKKGMLDEKRGLYIDRRTGEQMPIANAIDAGKVKVKYDDEGKSLEAVNTKTYAIHAVVDQRRKKRVSFQDAVNMGILEKDTGAYINNLTGERFYVADAIMKGFIKAHTVEDPSSLDIEAENKMVVEKVEKIKNKLLKPMRALNAFKSAAKTSHAVNGTSNGTK